MKVSGLASPARLLGVTRAAARGVAAVGGQAAAVGLTAASVVPALQPPAVRETAARVRTDVGREVSSAARALVDLHPARVRRRVWTSQGRAHIEVRGLPGSGPEHRRVSDDVRRRLGSLRGVRWAEVNAVTGQVLVAFDEGRVDVGSLLETVRRVEDAQGTREEDFPWNRPVYPGDTTPVAAATVELAADCIAVLAAVAGRAARLPAVPSTVRAGVALLEVERPLRRVLKRHIGPINTDLVLAVTSAAATGLSQTPVTPMVDALYRCELLAEALARRDVWRRRESSLCALPDLVPNEATERPPRPRPRPDGPVETWTEQLGPAALASAAAVLALTRRPGRAADALLVAVPRAARMGRGAFAAVAGTRLARQGVLPLNAGAFRRLDRISAVVVDSPALCTRRLQVLGAEAADGGGAAAIWAAAVPALRERTIDGLDDGPVRHAGLTLTRDRAGPPAPPGAVRLVVRRGRRRLGTVTVGRELDPHADALLDAATASGARVLLTEDASVADLVPRVDDVLAGEPLADAVRRLQEEGHGVLVVSEGDDAAVAAADVGVAVIGQGDLRPAVCWSADLLCGPGLVDAWRVLRATAAARPVSERAVRLARAGSALGTLLALVGGRRGRGSHALVPVHTAALVALLTGTRVALRATAGGPPPPVRHIPWHALDPVDVLAALDGSRAEEQSRAGSWRSAAVARSRSAASAVAASWVVRPVLVPTRRVLALAAATGEEMRDPLTPVLAVGAAASAIVGSGVDAVLVGGVVAGNAVISGAQRLRAESTLRTLLLEQEPSARRIPRSRARDGVPTAEDPGDVPHETVPARALGPGDIIALRAADVVPADARILAAQGLEVDESTLTGESLPVEKDVAATPAAPLAERRCMLFEGATVLAGSAHAVVVATGPATEAGRAARAGGRGAPRAGIQARLAEVTRKALPLTAFGGGAVTGLGLLRGVPLRAAVGAGVSIAVAAVPEGLPLVATVAQASAARRLSRRGVLVRSSRTLEAFGRVDTVCFDKTGTLTEGRLRVARLAGPVADLDPGTTAAQRILRTAARACPASEADAVAELPHATDRAVLEAGMTADASLGGWEPAREEPFETNRGYAASLGTDGDGAGLAVKGAPETLLPLCRNGSAAAARETAERLAADGLRVIAVAERRDVDVDVDVNGEPTDLHALVDDLELLGFVGIADRPRSGAADAVRRLATEGVRVVLVTGDHPLTATAIARAVGIRADTVVTGAELERMPERERVRRAAQASVFARVSPEQKVRIVEALRSGGSVVAMTGDGTNDAAAIRLADIGIGVAATGSTSARSAADVVLADADITRIHEALLEGRALWHRVRDAVSILVGGNAGEVGFMVLGTALAGRAPINVRQMLLVNVLTDMFPALAVAVAETPNGRVGTGTGGGEPVATAMEHGLRGAIVVRGSATALGATAAWGIGRMTGLSRRASTMGLAALVGTQLGQTLVMGRHSRLVVLTCAVSAAVLFAAVETPGVSQFLGCTPIGPVAWAVVLGASAVGTLVAVAAPRVHQAVTARQSS